MLKSVHWDEREEGDALDLWLEILEFRFDTKLGKDETRLVLDETIEESK